MGRALWGYNWQMVISDPGVNATEYYQFSVIPKDLKDNISFVKLFLIQMVLEI